MSFPRLFFLVSPFSEFEIWIVHEAFFWMYLYIFQVFCSREETEQWVSWVICNICFRVSVKERNHEIFWMVLERRPSVSATFDGWEFDSTDWLDNSDRRITRRARATPTTILNFFQRNDARPKAKDDDAVFETLDNSFCSYRFTNHANWDQAITSMMKLEGELSVSMVLSNALHSLESRALSDLQTSSRPQIINDATLQINGDRSSDNPTMLYEPVSKLQMIRQDCVSVPFLTSSLSSRQNTFQICTLLLVLVIPIESEN